MLEPTLIIQPVNVSLAGNNVGHIWKLKGNQLRLTSECYRYISLCYAYVCFFSVLCRWWVRQGKIRDKEALETNLSSAIQDKTKIRDASNKQLSGTQFFLRSLQLINQEVPRNLKVCITVFRRAYHQKQVPEQARMSGGKFLCAHLHRL